MHALREQRKADAPSAFRDRALSGLIGAAIVFGVATLSNSGGSTSALASEQQSDEQPRGLVSAIEQRRMIIQRLDRLIATLERIERDMPGDPPAANAHTR